MKRFVFSVILVTLVGLVVVWGEVEAVKTGYKIRQMTLEKRDLVGRQKLLELEVASLKTPRRLEEWLKTSQVKLTSSRLMKLAGLKPAERAQKSAPLARLFVETAQAGPDR